MIPHSIKVKLVNSYLETHPEIFTKEERDFIKTFTIYNKNFHFAPDTIREIYDELGILEDHQNIYLGFMNLLTEEFPIQEKRILEVGGGTIPRLGKRIHSIQTTGTIVIYDPKLSIYEENKENFTLVREKFQKTTNIEDANLLLGLMPCEASETIITSALENQTDFMIALCEGGPHGDYFDYFEDEDEWKNYILSYATKGVEEKNMGKLKIKTLKEYGDPYPVIYNKRK